jgi:hypothetical protein
MRLTGAAHMVYDVGMTSTAAFYPSEIFIDNVVGDMRRLADGSWVTLIPEGRCFRAVRVVCGNIVEVADEDGVSTGRCGAPVVGSEGFACEGHTDKARLERLRQLITPPPPPECGWYPESVLKALETLRAALEIFEEPYDIEVAIDDLTNARCTLPAGHHEYVVPFRDIYTPGCSHSADDPIHCGHEHRIDKWVKP